ncbi:hypothetical protein ABK040_003522 [Willaertia magna]
MDMNKTLKIWRIVIVSAKVIGDTNLIYNFDDNNLTLLLVVFELSVMANVPILAMFIDTLRKTEKNEKETFYNKCWFLFKIFNNACLYILWGVVIVGFEISMAIYGIAPTLEFELCLFRRDI